MTENELYHHGIKGMRWGIRRYQNEDGTLTDAGKKKYSKQYQKLSAKTNRDATKVSTQLYVDAYNKASTRFDLDKFNKDYDSDSMTYEEDFEEVFGNLLEKYRAQTYLEFMRTNKSDIKAKAFAEKYAMTSWDALAKDNADFVQELTDLANSKMKYEKD